MHVYLMDILLLFIQIVEYHKVQCATAAMNSEHLTLIQMCRKRKTIMCNSLHE